MVAAPLERGGGSYGAQGGRNCSPPRVLFFKKNSHMYAYVTNAAYFYSCETALVVLRIPCKQILTSCAVDN